MHVHTIHLSGLSCRRSLTSLLVAAGLVLAVAAVQAANPSSGTVSLSNPSVTWTGSITGAGTGENTCVDGVSCDSFQVVLAPGDYTNKQLNVRINWTVPAYDYDLFVHVGTLTGPRLPASAGPPPSTQELVHVGIDPPVATTQRIWWVHIQAATVPPGDTYHGTAELANLPPAPVIDHQPGQLPFSHTTPLFARGTVRTEEPSVRVDVRGNCYVSGIRGVPGGVDLWRFDLNPSSPTYDPEMRNPLYLGQPDVLQQQGATDSTAGGADGGGDIEIATSFPTDPDETPVVTMVSLAAANISSNWSTDRGDHFQHNGAVALIPSDDRQWIEADGPNTIYMVYRAPSPASGLFVQKSTDHGMTYGAAFPIVVGDDPADTTPGYIDVDHADGTVYVSHQNDNALYVSHSIDGGTTWTNVLVDALTAHGHLFDPVKVGDDGTVYVAWSNDRHIYYSFSTDHGNSWTVGATVDDPDATQTNVFPWLEAGSAGRVDVVWFGTTSPNISAAEWDVYFSQSLDANSAAPTFRQQAITDHRVHGSNISEGGLTGSANRNLGDYFQIAYDTQGAAVISFADDHNDFDGNTYVTRQLGGPGLLGSVVDPVQTTEPPLYDVHLPEVVDPRDDAVVYVDPVPTDNPFDIVSVKYYSDNGPGGPYIGARLQVSDLTAQAPPGTWRIAFTANAPGITDQRPNGVSDHGDMFYLLVADTSAIPMFTYGTAYRDSEPLVPLNAYAMAYNNAVGVADSGAIDVATGTISIKVAIAKLNALIPEGHPLIGQGSWLCGLRGAAGTPGNGPRDNTRGGRFNFYVDYLGTLAVEPWARASLALRAWPNPAPGGTEIHFSLPETGETSLGIYDIEGRLVRSLISRRVAAGSYAVQWDGRGAGGSLAPNGVYFARLKAASRETTSRLAIRR